MLVTLIHSLIYFAFLSNIFCIDVSSNQVTFKIQEEWDQKYSDPTTNEYVNLKQQLVEEVNELNQCFVSRYFYFYLLFIKIFFTQMEHVS